MSAAGIEPGTLRELKRAKEARYTMNRSGTDTLMGRSIDNPDLAAQLQLGVDAIQIGDKSTAHSIFQRSTAQNPEVPEMWVWLGATSADLNAAEVAFKRALDLDPNNQEAQLGLRWVALRRPVLVGPVGATMDTGKLDGTEIWASDTPRSVAPATTDAKGGVNILGAEIPVAMAVAIGVALAVMMVLLVLYVVSG
jgi:hypothetical protein